jgi:hypothetical protein
MAYFAKIDENNIVINVIAVNNKVITDANGVEQEQLGVDFINNIYNTTDVWKQTSYNSTFRKNYAGLGFTYDQTRDAFIAPKPFNSWILNENTCKWEAPVARPEENLPYIWSEEQQNWVLLSE